MINRKQIHALYGLKWNPFLPEIPTEALIKDESTKRFCWRAEQVVMDGGFALVTGEPGTGKSVAMRQLQSHLRSIPELAVRTISRPQSRIQDFYRELAELFDAPIRPSNRYGGFTVLREKWMSHIKASMFRPVILVDEAQEAHDDVLNELRLLASVDLIPRTSLPSCLQATTDCRRSSGKAPCCRSKAESESVITLINARKRNLLPYSPRQLHRRAHRHSSRNH